MESDTLTVPFSFAPASERTPSVVDVSASEVMGQLLKKGFQFINLIGLPGHYADHSGTASPNVRIWVDRDAADLVESYLVLENLAAQGETWKHFTFLLDGGLQITAEAIPKSLSLTIERCPGLDIQFLSQLSIKILPSVYLATWRNAIAVIKEV